MKKEVKIRLSIPGNMHDQMKLHPEVDWNEAAIREIAKRLAAVGGAVEGEECQSPKSIHRKL